MSGPVAVVVVCGVLAIAGLGVLALLGVARSARDVLRYSPVAPLAGMAWVGVLAATSATAGVGLGMGGLLAVTAATCASGAIRIARRDASAQETDAGLPPPPSTRLELGLAAVALVVLGAVLAVALATYRVKPLIEYDGWAMWGMKAKAIALLDADAAVLASSAYERLHLEYPLLLPALNALPIDAVEAFDSNVVVLSCVALGLAGVLALWGLLRERARPAALLPFLAAVVAMPAFFYQLGSGYADAPLAMFVAAGVVAAGRWLLDRREAWLALATLFLAAGALTKNEGLLFALATLVALFAAAAGRRRAVALSAAVVAVVYAPWRIFVAVHELGAPDYDLSSSFDVPYVARRVDRIPDAVWGVLEQAVRPGEVGVLLLAGVAFGVLTLVLGRVALGLFATGFAVLSLAGLAWIYVISPLEVSSYVSSSAHRVILSTVVALAALCPLLLEECARAFAPREPSGSPGSLSRGGRASPVLGRHPPP